MSETTAIPRYGFRYDPMEFVDTDATLQGAQVRTSVFRYPSQGDQGLLDRRIGEILALQRKDGRFADTSKETGRTLLEALELGLPHHRSEVQRAVSAILRQKRSGQNANEWLEREGCMSVYPLHALCLLGRSDVEEVAFSLRWLAERPEEYVGFDKGCPWCPIVVLKGLWAGRAYEDVDVGPAIDTGLRWIDDNLNEAGCLGWKDPWGVVDCAGYIDLPLTRDIIEKQIPMILRAQKSDGGWGDRSLNVFRALVTHGLLEQLSSLPPLPSDWRIAREIPAPSHDLFTMTWDGHNLWVRDTKANEAISVSTEGGEVLKRVKLPVDKVFGIGWWDDALALTQTEPKRLLKVDAETGDIRQEILLDDMEEVLGVAQVEGEMWIGDGFTCSARVIDLADTSCRRWQTPAGPGPLSLTPEGDALWHIDFWAPAIIKSARDGRLLDWGEKPFDGAIEGLAWDGQSLWALDSQRKRICVIEKEDADAE